MHLCHVIESHDESGDESHDESPGESRDESHDDGSHASHITTGVVPMCASDCSKMICCSWSKNFPTGRKEKEKRERECAT